MQVTCRVDYNLFQKLFLSFLRDIDLLSFTQGDNMSQCVNKRDYTNNSCYTYQQTRQSIIITPKH